MKVAVGRGIYDIPCPEDVGIQSTVRNLANELNKRVNFTISTNGLKTQSNEYILLSTAIELIHEIFIMQDRLKTIGKTNELNKDAIDHSKAQQVTIEDEIATKVLESQIAVKSNDQDDYVIKHLEDLLRLVKKTVNYVK